jgi:CheY-like chemotaxis protein
MPTTRKKLFVHWAPETRFAAEGQPGLIADLPFGQRIRLQGRPRPGATETEDIAITASKPARVPPGLTPEPKAILIADDELNIRESLAAVLREDHYAVCLAENGRVAVQKVLDGPPDLILLDLNMPDTDGWKAFDVIARLAPDLPVIVITARSGQARRAAEAGIDMLLEKPLDVPVLLETIRTLLASPEKSRFARVLRAWRTNDMLGTQE